MQYITGTMTNYILTRDQVMTAGLVAVILLFSLLATTSITNKSTGGAGAISLFPPTLLSPAANSITTSLPTFYWTNVTNADSYRIQITKKTDATFRSPVISKIVYQAKYTPTSKLANDNYLWRVQSKYKRTTSSWSASSAFQVSEKVANTSFFDNFSSYNTP